MNTIFFIKGFMLGLGLAIPIGPIGILCVRNSLTKGRSAGLFTGLGAATADLIYAACAAFGLSFITNYLVSHQTLLHTFAGLFLCYLGTSIFNSKPLNSTKTDSYKGPLVTYISTFFLTLSNPMTILLFIALFATLGIENDTQSSLNAFLFISAVFSGSALGWLSLTNLIHLFRSKVTLLLLQRINSIAGILIITFGIITLVSPFLSR